MTNWDEYEDPFLPPKPAWWSKLVRCNVCGEVYQSEELTYLEELGVWVCRNSCKEEPDKCCGTEHDIVVLDTPPDRGEEPPTC